jgi:DNA-directed RNA polymerase specialized sigma24 family protein
MTVAAYSRIKADDTARPENLESRAGFHEAVEQIPDDEREVFQLVWYGGMAQKEVAAIAAFDRWVFCSCA